MTVVEPAVRGLAWLAPGYRFCSSDAQQAGSIMTLTQVHLQRSFDLTFLTWCEARFRILRDMRSHSKAPIELDSEELCAPFDGLVHGYQMSKSGGNEQFYSLVNGVCDDRTHTCCRHLCRSAMRGAGSQLARVILQMVAPEMQLDQHSRQGAWSLGYNLFHVDPVIPKCLPCM
jgi:hypothetical protein